MHTSFKDCSEVHRFLRRLLQLHSHSLSQTLALEMCLNMTKPNMHYCDFLNHLVIRAKADMSGTHISWYLGPLQPPDKSLEPQRRTAQAQLSALFPTSAASWQGFPPKTVGYTEQLEVKLLHWSMMRGKKRTETAHKLSRKSISWNCKDFADYSVRVVGNAWRLQKLQDEGSRELTPWKHCLILMSFVYKSPTQSYSCRLIMSHYVSGGNYQYGLRRTSVHARSNSSFLPLLRSPRGLAKSCQ